MESWRAAGMAFSLYFHEVIIRLCSPIVDERHALSPAACELRSLYEGFIIQERARLVPASPFSLFITRFRL